MENIIDQILPKAEPAVIAKSLRIIIEEVQKEKQLRLAARNEFLQKVDKSCFMRLQSDAYDAGLSAELAEFYLEHPEMDSLSLSKSFRREFDI